MAEKITPLQEYKGYRWDELNKHAMANEGLKFDKEKLRWDLLPITEIEGIVKVLTFGAKKYAPNNWQLVDGAKERYYAAIMRHLVAYRKGELIDSESGLSHISHAMCNLVFLEWFNNNEHGE